METEFSSREAAQKERAFNFGWMIGVLGLAIVAAAVIAIVYANSSPDLQQILFVLILLLLSVCGFMVTMLCIGLNDANKWLKNERDKT